MILSSISSLHHVLCFSHSFCRLFMTFIERFWCMTLQLFCKFELGIIIWWLQFCGNMIYNGIRHRIETMEIKKLSQYQYGSIMAKTMLVGLKQCCFFCQGLLGQGLQEIGRKIKETLWTASMQESAPAISPILSEQTHLLDRVTTELVESIQRW